MRRHLLHYNTLSFCFLFSPKAQFTCVYNWTCWVFDQVYDFMAQNNVIVALHFSEFLTVLSCSIHTN